MSCMGVVYVIWFILSRYECRKGDLMARNCASVLSVLCGSACSELCMSGGGAINTVCCFLLYVYMVFKFNFIVSDVLVFWVSVNVCGVV